MQFPGRQWEQHGVLPYPPPVTLRCVTRWDLSWQGKTHLVWKAAVKKKKKHLCVMTSFGGLFGLFFFFLRTSEMSLLPVACPVDVFLTFISQCLSFIPPFFSHSRVSRSFLIHRQHPTPCPWLLPLFPSLCLSGKLCLPCQSPCRLVLCGFCADSGVGFEGKA